MTSSEKIRKARKERGITQKQLAKMLNITQATICDMEKKDTPLKIPTLAKIAAALEVPALSLVGDDISGGKVQEIALPEVLYTESRQNKIRIACDLLKEFSGIAAALADYIDGTTEQIIIKREAARDIVEFLEKARKQEEEAEQERETEKKNTGKKSRTAAEQRTKAAKGSSIT